jgi:outer membrane murein-binding lipoprotein Lpp
MNTTEQASLATTALPLGLAVLLATALLASSAALLLGIVALHRSRTAQARRTTAVPVGDLPTDVEGLRAEVQALRTEASQALRHLAVVRYDAFGDMSGHLSWSLALADDAGDGVLLTSIHGRSEARAYAKNLRGWSSEQQLSPEEQEAVRLASTA